MHIKIVLGGLDTLHIINIPEAFETAFKHQQMGRFEQAETLYLDILKEDPNNIGVINMLGILYDQTTRPDLALTYMKKAAQLDPENEGLQNNLGLALISNNQVDEAITVLKKAIEKGPSSLDIRNSLGAAFYKAKRYSEAIECYQDILQENPNFTDAHFNLGKALQDIRQFDQAIAAYQQVLKLTPNNVKALISLGSLMMDSNNLEQAEHYYQKALNINPISLEANYNLGLVYHRQGQLNKAIVKYQQVLSINPKFADAINGLGAVYSRQFRFQEAIDLYEEALQNGLATPNILSNLANIYVQHHQFDKAEAYYQQAITQNAYAHEIHINQALLWLQQGNYEAGWPEYEWRLFQNEYSQKILIQPAWNGASLEGKQILLLPEQGLGNTFFMLRYIPLLKEQGANVIYECPPDLHQLLSGFTEIDQLVPPFNSPYPSVQHDYNLYLMSLPFVFKTTLETIPPLPPFNPIQDALLEKWQQAFQADKRFKIGIVWSGKVGHPLNPQRSCTLDDFLTLTQQFPDITLYSLQKGPASDQIKQMIPNIQCINLEPALNDFTDTAAAILNLDLVITVDTSVAHLAGLLQKPVWTLLSYTPDWRWLMDRKDTPWYPTMRLFRQATPGDWKSVFEEVSSELATILNTVKI